MQHFLLLLLGLFVGSFSGLFGLGGAVIIIPALVFLFGFQQQTAQGTSVAMLLPPIGLLAAWRYWQAGHVNVKVAALLALGFFVGAAIGAHFAVEMQAVLLKKLFGGALIILGIITILTT